MINFTTNSKGYTKYERRRTPSYESTGYASISIRLCDLEDVLKLIHNAPERCPNITFSDDECAAWELIRRELHLYEKE